ncbi:DUF6161 domain-containing protein [uncultured Ruegeria sp.]|uniref:DUF6161 domain-containing protein n=1 Tax=uncultured Ruegeria sp. TaxID=259304 RepID=UPI00261CB19B|nr:DUF6161 domain-containing protein [uncultured Ruegeria sp.]
MELKIELKTGKPIGFNDARGVIDWAAEELSAWNWLNGTHYGRNIWPDYQAILSNLSSAAKGLVENPSEAALEQELIIWLNKISDRIAKGLFITSDSRLGKFIMGEQVQNCELAAAILNFAQLETRENTQSNKAMFLAASAFSNFERGLSKAGATSTAKNLDQLVDDFTSKLSELVNSSEDKLGQLDDAIAKRSDKAEKSIKGLAQLIKQISGSLEAERASMAAKLDQEIEDAINRTKESLSKFEDAIKTEMALRAPAEYWKKKKYWHRLSTSICGAVFVGASIASVSILKGYVLSYGDLSAFFEFWREASIAAFASFGTILAIGMIFLRILYRLFASQLHLWNDSSERVTMILTYLALAEKGHAKDEFLGGLLARLFSPASDGVIKDDLGSVGPMDFIAKNLPK